MCKVRGLWAKNSGHGWAQLSQSSSVRAVLRNGDPAGARTPRGQALFLGGPSWGLAGCLACLLGVLFGPYLRPGAFAGSLGPLSRACSLAATTRPEDL